MNSSQDWWNKKHLRYSGEDWLNKPSIFAEWVVKYFPKQGRILDIGAGQGQDSRYFAGLGYTVTAIDFSDTATEENINRSQDYLGDNLTIKKLDITPPLPFSNDTFDVIYAHLSTHFFDEKRTKSLFSEFYRILSTGGILAILENSKEDPEYGTGRKLENDYFELSPGDVKRFYDIDSMRMYAQKFNEIVLDNKGETYKDKAKGVINLIRYVGKK